MKKILLYCIVLISILFLIRCEKDENSDLIKNVFFANKIPQLTTINISEITDTSAVTGGIITNNGGSNITSNGVCWSTSANPSINDKKTVDSIGKTSFKSKLANLKTYTTYYVKAYATNAVGTAYGNSLTFTTSTNIAKISTKNISLVTDSSAQTGGVITTDGGAVITTKGVCWSTTQAPNLTNSFTNDGIGIDSFISKPVALLPNTSYYLRAYATNGVGTAFGEEKSFTTITALPKLTTNPITSNTQTTAISGGIINSDGGLSITARGVCWSTSSNPTIADNKTINGIGSGSFISNIAGLSPGLTYYVKSYATNSLGTAYGNELNFITSTSLPTLTTNTITSITDSSAISGGNITSDGGLTVTVKGICWSTSPNPTTLNFQILNGSGTGSFISNLNGLSPGITYYVRAFATNNAGTAYGNEKNFTTLAVLPSLTTTTITSITSTSAISGGNVSNSGGTAVTDRGVCWSTSQNPTLIDSTTSNGNGIGTFLSNLANLTPLTTYYVRSYAKNIIGTAYGNEMNFNTTMPTIGQSYQGGIVAYILQPGDSGYIVGQTHGIIATSINQGGGVWYNGSYTPTFAVGTYIGTGNFNTNTIVAIQGAGNYAASICYNLVLNGYSDWYLPSKNELNILYINRNLIGGFSVISSYWSSSETIGTNVSAWQQSFSDGTQQTWSKSSGGIIRAIRSF